MSAQQERARALLGDALGVAPEELAADASIDKEPQWSSLAHMRLVVDLEAHLGVTLETQEMLELSSLSGIAAVLERYRHGR